MATSRAPILSRAAGPSSLEPGDGVRLPTSRARPSTARWAQVASSLGQLVVNRAGIVVAAVIVLIVARRSKHPTN